MSMISSLAIFLLCVASLSMSSGRLIGVVDMEAQPTTTLQVPPKSLEGMKVVEKSLSKANATLVDERGVSMEKKGERNMNSKKNDNDHDQKQLLKEKRYNKASFSYVKEARLTKNKFPKGVSWRVPKKKGGMPEPGFNFDYAPPKVHPPTHN